MFTDVGWFVFFENIKGYNVKVSREFARKLTWSQVDFTSLSFEVSETSIVEATGFPTDGDKWFKQFYFEAYSSLFLVSGYETLDSSKFIHLSALKEEWN